jgi:hypothetical protein
MINLKDVFWTILGVLLLLILVLSFAFTFIFFANHETFSALISFIIFISLLIFFLYIMP